MNTVLTQNKTALVLPSRPIEKKIIISNKNSHFSRNYIIKMIIFL